MWTHYLFVCTGESIPRSASQTAKKKNVCGKSLRGSAQQQLARSIQMLRISSPHSVWQCERDSARCQRGVAAFHSFLFDDTPLPLWGPRKKTDCGWWVDRYEEQKKKKIITEREELNGRKGRAERAKEQSQGSGAGCVAECEQSEAIPRERPACDQCKHFRGLRWSWMRRWGLRMTGIFGELTGMAAFWQNRNGSFLIDSSV